MKWTTGTDEDLEQIIVTSINLFYTWLLIVTAMVGTYIALKVGGVL